MILFYPNFCYVPVDSKFDLLVSSFCYLVGTVYYFGHIYFDLFPLQGSFWPYRQQSLIQMHKRQLITGLWRCGALILPFPLLQNWKSNKKAYLSYCTRSVNNYNIREFRFQELHKKVELFQMVSSIPFLISTFVSCHWHWM